MKNARWWIGVVLAVAWLPGSSGAQWPVQTIELTPGEALPVLTWTELGSDPAGDGTAARLPDLRSLAVAAGADGRVWFRLTLEGEVPSQAFGLNLALDIDRDQSTGSPWWGTDTGFTFDRLVTVWVLDGGSFYQGMMGVADHDRAMAGDFGTSADGHLRVAAPPGDRTLVVGVDLETLDPDGDFDLVATVGSFFMANDHLPNGPALRVQLAPKRTALSSLHDLLSLIHRFGRRLHGSSGR